MQTRLLLVNDNVKLANMASHDISELRPEWKTLMAGSCEEAKKLFHAFTPHAAVLDVGLPDGDGLELMSEFKAMSPRMPVIMMSGNGSNDMRERAYDLGCWAFMEKPFNLGSLVVNIENAVDHARLKLLPRIMSPGETREDSECCALSLPSRDTAMALYEREEFIQKVIRLNKET